MVCLKKEREGERKLVRKPTTCQVDELGLINIIVQVVGESSKAN